MTTLKDRKKPGPPKCRACHEILGVKGVRSLPAAERAGVVKRGGHYYHDGCAA